MTIIGSGTNCGRTTRNSVLTETLVFHQTLSTPKATTTSGIRRAHLEGEPERSTFSFSKDPIMKTSYNTSPSQTLEFLKSTLLQYQIQSAER
jgi:hypothetical protein